MFVLVNVGFVHVPQAHIVTFDWSVLLFNERGGEKVYDRGWRRRRWGTGGLRLGVSGAGRGGGGGAEFADVMATVS